MEAKSEASENEAKKCQIFEKGRFLLQKVVKNGFQFNILILQTISIILSQQYDDFIFDYFPYYVHL